MTFYYFLLINKTGITSGRIKKEARKRKKCVYNPADLQVALPEIQGGIPKKEQQQASQISKGPAYSYD